MSELQKEYNENRSAFLKGEISESQWMEFCGNVLDELLIENKETFVRLKNS